MGREVELALPPLRQASDGHACAGRGSERRLRSAVCHRQLQAFECSSALKRRRRQDNASPARPSRLFSFTMNLSTAFAASAQQHALKPALFWGEQEYTYEL